MIVLNKADLVDLAPYQWVIGLYTQLGYETLVTSAADGRGIDRLRELLAPGGDGLLGPERRRQELAPERDPAGPEPPRPRGLRLDLQGEAHDHHRRADPPRLAAATSSTRPASASSSSGASSPAELEGHFVEFRPYIPLCKFPDCSHTHEADCAVKDAVHWGQIHPGRFESYLKLYAQQPIEMDEE